MTAQTDDVFEHQLREMTTWKGKPQELWRHALRESRVDTAHLAVHRRVLKWRPRLAAATGVAVVAVVVGISMYRSAKSPGGRPAVATRAPASTDLWSFVRRNSETPMQFVSPSASKEMMRADALVSKYVELDSAAHGPDFPGRIGPAPAEDTDTPARSAMSATQRRVIRKATIELTATDVRAAFLKAMLLVRESGGEFVQDSALTGSGKTTQANLTLRVAADRLSDVLNALRDLGEVASERREGQDVTTQVIDVEARLRNERRVEAEMLELFDKRPDAPLTEVLNLRTRLGEVRREIERLTAQRANLARLVSLATVLVLIRTPDAEAASEAGLRAYLADVLDSAWHQGWTFLADSLALVLSILVGGLLWWALLAIAFLGVRRYLRSRPPSRDSAA